MYLYLYLYFYNKRPCCRTRTCDSPTPFGLGLPCVGVTQENETCSSAACASTGDPPGPPEAFLTKVSVSIIVNTKTSAPDLTDL